MDEYSSSQAARASLGQYSHTMDPNNPCYATVEAINGIQMQTMSTHSTRAQCLEFYCELIHDTKLPAARQNAETSKATYDTDDQAFKEALRAYVTKQEAYQTYYDKVSENLALAETAGYYGSTSHITPRRSN